MNPIKENSFIFEKSENSLKPALVILLMMTIPLVLWSDFAPNNNYRSKLEWLILLVYGLCLASFLLERRSRDLGWWLFLSGLVLSLVVGAVLLEIPALLTLLFIPVVLACSFFGMRQALYFSFGVVILTFLIPITQQTGWVEAFITLTAVSAAYILLYYLVRPIYDSQAWVDEYYHKGLDYWNEARSNQQKLLQTLEELTHANEQLRRMNFLTQSLRQEAEEARRIKEGFVANVSHELRTPLNMIIGFSEHIVKNPQTYGPKIPPALLADLMVIYRNAAHLTDLIDDILDLNQIELGQMALSRNWADLNEIIEDALLVMRPLFVGKGLTLSAEITPDLPKVYCDRLRIREVLINLLSNAGRFTEKGKVSLEVQKMHPFILFKVSDTGPGIKEKDISKLFQPFQQLDDSIRRRYGGTGLGLNISKNYIDMHGGKIWVESQEGLGTTFLFTLPDFTSEQPEENFERWLVPDWEYYQKLNIKPAYQTSIRPRFLVLEKGSILRRILTRYYDIGEYFQVTSFEQVQEEMQKNPARALYINDDSVASAMGVYTQPDLLPKGLPVVICSIPEKIDTLGTYDGLEFLTKPISREKLLGVIQNLKINNGTVLIVDDRVDALQLYKRIFSSFEGDYSVVQATDGEEAVTIMAEYPPDLILLDLIMPGMDGFQFLEHLNREGLLNKQKIVVVSAFDLTVQPILVESMGLTRGGGLSLAQFLESIKALSRVFELPD